MRHVIRRQNSIYYFRKIIPQAVRQLLGLQKREFCTSLRTTDHATALWRAEPILKKLESIISHFENLNRLQELQQLMAKKKKEEKFQPIEIPDNLLKIDKIRTLPDGTFEIEGLELDPDKQEAENAAFSQIVAELKGTSPAPRKTTSTAGAVLLSELIEKFVSDKHKSGAWKLFDVEGNRRKLLRFLEVVGDLPITEYTVDHAQTWRDFVLKMPPRSQNMTVEEVWNSTAKTTIAPKTVDYWLGLPSSMINWACRKHVGGLSVNVFSSLQTSKKRRPDTERRATTAEEIRTLFEHIKFDKAEPSLYWVPRIAAYSGMRVSEICQLMTDDIKEIDGIWAIDINDNGDGKSLKTPNSRRIVPIHSKLLKLGFLEFVAKRTAPKPRQLFGEIRAVNGKAGHSSSRKFGRLRDKLIRDGILPESSADMTFHGLRHSVATAFRNAEVPETLAAEILGHEAGETMSYSRYAKKGALEKLREAIEKVSWE